MSLLLFGSGFVRPYPDDRAELADAGWRPSSLDFGVTATKSGGGTGVDDFVAFLKAIEAASFNSIDSLGIIGHADPGVLALGGTMHVGGGVINVTVGQRIDKANLETALKANIIQPLRNRFKRTDDTVPTIILYGCHAGATDELLIALRDAFNVGSCQGFTNELEWCKRDQRGRVIERGRVRVKTGQRPPCTSFPTSVWSLRPDTWK